MDAPEVVNEAEGIADIILVCERRTSGLESVVNCRLVGGYVQIVTGEGRMLDGGGSILMEEWRIRASTSDMQCGTDSADMGAS